MLKGMVKPAEAAPSSVSLTNGRSPGIGAGFAPSLSSDDASGDDGERRQVCTRTHCGTHVQDGTLDLLRCPNTTCKAPLPPHLLKAVLDTAQFERWERLTLERTLDCMEDLVYCPRCDTAVVEVRV
jgi:hypothetical protein